MLDKTLLMKELRQWSHTVLEQPQGKFNNLPACPFAKKTWNNNKVNVVVSQCSDWSDLMDSIISFDDTYDVIIYCGDDYENMTADELHERVHLLNGQANPLNLYLMGSHPDSEIPFATDEEFNELFDDDYYVVFLQRLDTLIQASDNIFKKGYYNNYDNNEFQSQILNRRKLWQV